MTSPKTVTPVDVGAINYPDRSTWGIERTYVQLDHHVPGVLYEPTRETERSHIAFVLMHSYDDYTTHFAINLVNYGYRVLATDPLASRARTERGTFHLHDTLPDLAKAVSYVRNHPSVDVTINFSASAGPQLTALYQNVAENGIGIGRDERKIYPLPDYLGDGAYPPADGVILLDPHLGDAPKGLIDLGPQVIDPENPQNRRGEVDMLDPENGYDPGAGAASYDEAFLDRFYRAQADRMERLVTENRQRLREIETDGRPYPDDDGFVLVDVRSRVFRPDPSVLSHTRNEHELLHHEDSAVSDEPVTEEQVQSIRGPKRPDYEPPITYLGDEVEPQSVRRFLSTRAIRPTPEYRLTADTIEGIDWNSSNAQVPGNLETVSSPLYIQSMTGHYFVVQSELMWEHANSSDTTLHYVEGATHLGDPVDPRYGETREVILDAIDRWTSERFL